MSTDKERVMAVASQCMSDNSLTQVWANDAESDDVWVICAAQTDAAAITTLIDEAKAAHDASGSEEMPAGPFIPSINDTRIVELKMSKIQMDNVIFTDETLEEVATKRFNNAVERYNILKGTA
jgi:hypothetical protein